LLILCTRLPLGTGAATPSASVRTTALVCTIGSTGLGLTKCDVELGFDRTHFAIGRAVGHNQRVVDTLLEGVSFTGAVGGYTVAGSDCCTDAIDAKFVGAARTTCAAASVAATVFSLTVGATRRDLTVESGPIFGGQADLACGLTADHLQHVVDAIIELIRYAHPVKGDVAAGFAHIAH